MTDVITDPFLTEFEKEFPPASRSPESPEETEITDFYCEAIAAAPSIVDKLQMAFVHVHTGAVVRGAAPSLRTSGPLTIGEQEGVQVVVAQTATHFDIAVSFSLQQDPQYGGAYHLDRATGKVEQFMGALDPQEAAILTAAALPTMVRSALGYQVETTIDRPEQPVVVDVVAPVQHEAENVDPYVDSTEDEALPEETVHQAAIGLMRELFEGVIAQNEGYDELGALVERRSVVITIDNRRHTIVERRAVGMGPDVYWYTVQVDGLGEAPATFELTIAGVADTSPNRKWRDPTNAIRTIDDVFAVFCGDLLDATSFGNHPKRD